MQGGRADSFVWLPLWAEAPKYIANFLDSLLGQSEAADRVLLYENVSDDATKHRAGIFIPRSARLRQAWRVAACQRKVQRCDNDGKGKYICFLNMFDYIQDFDWLKKMPSLCLKMIDIDIAGGYKEGFEGKSYIEKCQNAYYRQFLYRTEKIAQ